MMMMTMMMVMVMVIMMTTRNPWNSEFGTKHFGPPACDRCTVKMTDFGGTKNDRAENI